VSERSERTSERGRVIGHTASEASGVAVGHRRTGGADRIGGTAGQEVR
jgi:hypothetical protein